MRRAVLFAASVLALAACTSETTARDIPGLRLATKSYRFTVAPRPLPPFANETTFYTITVVDRTTGQPVQNGEGQIYEITSPDDNLQAVFDYLVKS